ncbi:Gfo/Idh/MocA family oxidoreductase [Candidatus Bipolaricaulota bacterium]|nr:Gfo/Idh/MocA family oxidoreductase [Candidatus Bipolaricaulota bacterium]
MNNKVKAKWGILGTAKIAREALIPGLRDSNSSKLAAIASRSKEKAKEFAEKFNVPKSYGSYEELLNDNQLEFVYIPLPNHLHTKWSIKSARAGKHVLCEKPLGTSTKEVKEAFEAAKQEGVKLMEGFMYRFHPQTRRVKELLNRGEIGEFRFFRGAHSFSLVTQDREDDIRWKEEMGGGSLMDLGTYSINTVRYLFAEEPMRVTARQTVHPDHTAEAETQAIFEFPGGKTATFDSSFLLDHRANYEIISKTGRIKAFNTYNPGLGRKTRIEIKKGDVIEEETINEENEYALEVDELVEAARENRDPLLGPEESINNARALEATRKSAEKRGWVEV